MGLYPGGLIIGRIFAFEIWRAYVRESLFSEGLVIGILRHTVVECKKNFDHTAEPQETSSCREQFESDGMGLLSRGFLVVNVEVIFGLVGA